MDSEIGPKGGKAYDIYVIFSHDDAEFVDKLRSTLEEEGVRVRVDWESGYERGRARQAEEIEQSEVVGVVISSSAVTTGHWKRQLEIARRYRKQIIPIVYRQLPRPDLVPPFLTSIPPIDFSIQAEVNSSLSRLMEGIPRSIRIQESMNHKRPAHASSRLKSVFFWLVGIATIVGTGATVYMCVRSENVTSVSSGKLTFQECRIEISAMIENENEFLTSFSKDVPRRIEATKHYYSGHGLGRSSLFTNAIRDTVQVAEDTVEAHLLSLSQGIRKSLARAGFGDTSLAMIPEMTDLDDQYASFLRLADSAIAEYGRIADAELSRPGSQ